MRGPFQIARVRIRKKCLSLVRRDGSALLGLVRVGRRLLLARRTHAKFGGKAGTAWYMAISVLCYLALFAVGIAVVTGNTGCLYWLVPVMILLIAEASRNAWHLLVMPRGGHGVDKQVIE